MRRAAFSTPSRVAEFAPRGGREQLRIRHGVPERVGKPAGGGVWLQLRIGRRVQPEQEVRRLQHRLHHQLRALQEIGFARHQRFVALLLRCVERTAECLQSELADEARAAGSRRLAGNQTVGIAAVKRVRASRSAAAL